MDAALAIAGAATAVEKKALVLFALCHTRWALSSWTVSKQLEPELDTEPAAVHAREQRHNRDRSQPSARPQNIFAWHSLTLKTTRQKDVVS